MKFDFQCVLFFFRSFDYNGVGVRRKKYNTDSNESLSIARIQSLRNLLLRV